MEAKFQEVKEYIRANPIVIPPYIISYKLIISDNGMIRQWFSMLKIILKKVMQCEKCGAPIRSGRFCEKCKYEMSMDLQSVLPKKPVGTQNTRISRDGERMRYL